MDHKNYPNPYRLAEEMLLNFNSIEQFNRLVQASAFYYREHGVLKYFQILIPNGSNKERNYLHKWTPEIAEQAADEMIDFFTKEVFCSAYYKEVHDDGIYLAFKPSIYLDLSYVKYLNRSNTTLQTGRHNGIYLKGSEWLKDLPHEFYASFYTRNVINEYLYFAKKREEWKKTLVPKALYDGDQNWLNNIKYPKIENWNPPENANFTVVHEWPHLNEDDEDKIEYFLNEINNKN